MRLRALVPRPAKKCLEPRSAQLGDEGWNTRGGKFENQNSDRAHERGGNSREGNKESFVFHLRRSKTDRKAQGILPIIKRKVVSRRRKGSYNET